ncbi:hypothetical protein [Actinomadura alba]|uniref:SPW repeat-containing protein n=1 Tax=Actinomadura alba TaxID=406431 RepID=A0ABR7M1G7_9ACTN|nr:hypothetical protein [Actinomadura alba]MBC6470957.1 hypothetical protein [Actinomadura alba]
MRSGRVAARLGRQTLTLGTLVVAAGYAWLAETALSIGGDGRIEWIIPGLAVIGVVFYDALGTRPGAGGFPHAFALGLGLLIALGVAVAGLVQLFPRHVKD